MFFYFIMVIIGFILLIKGADFLVDGSVAIAKKFKISELIIGLTIVSIGTSMPELMVSFTSAGAGYNDISIGNIIGSNICNLLLILGLAAIIIPIEIKRETRLVEIPLTLLVTFIVFLMGNLSTDNIISRREGIILFSLFIGFIIYTIYMAIRKKEEEVDINVKNISIVKAIILIIVGVVSLKYGGDLVVDNAVNIAKAFDINEKIISLTIVSIGTSLPELVTVISATRKKESDIAIGNILGSCIFNYLFILGVSAIFNPIQYSVSYNKDMIVLFISIVLLSIFPDIVPKNKMTKRNGYTYLAIYTMYMTSLFIN